LSAPRKLALRLAQYPDNLFFAVPTLLHADSSSEEPLSLEPSGPIFPGQVSSTAALPAVTAKPEIQETSLPAIAAKPEIQEASSAYRCDGRTHCSQMTSCAEATYFLRNCSGVEMDGDHDGVPCEQQ